MQHPKEKIDIVRWLRNFETAFVLLFVRESNSQGQFFSDEVNRAQPQGELLQKATQYKEERLGGFDFIFEFEAFLKRLRRPDELERSIGLSVRLLPHSDRFRPKPDADLLLI